MNKKRANSVNSNNFRPQQSFSSKEETKGTRPLSNPVSVQGALLSMLIHGCRKFIFLNTNLRVAIYGGLLFTSLAWDYAPLPRSYFSRSSNALNQYFVKLGWMWTLIWTVPFVILTSLTYCCGNWKMVRRHLARIGIATASWFIFTKLFVHYENNYGRCSAKGFNTKQSCLTGGYFWHSLEISGHAFILIYSALVMIEEARAIIGWESIDHLLREELHNRSVNVRDLSSPLKNLNDNQLEYLNEAYARHTPFIKALFVAMTFFICLWDVMILSTALYFHKMVEKLIGGLLAIAVWYLTYNFWYPRTKFLPYAPGVGLFSYQTAKKPDRPNRRQPAQSREKIEPKVFNGQAAGSSSGEDYESMSRSELFAKFLEPKGRSGAIVSGKM